MNTKILLISSVVVAFLSLLLVSTGITGFMTLEQGKGTLCSSDEPCKSPEVCCNFYEESDSGVCSLPENCDSIYNLTMAQKIEADEFRASFNNENYLNKNESEASELKGSYLIQIILGSLITALVIIQLLFHFKLHNHETNYKKKKQHT